MAQATNHYFWLSTKVQTIPQKPWKKTLNKIDNKNNPTCTLNGPVHDMNLCKII